MKRIIMLTTVLLCLVLAGCSPAAFWLSGCGGRDADLVVINDSGQGVWSIELAYEDQTQWVQNAGAHPLLESGQSYGLELEEGTSQVTVVLSKRWDRELARRRVDFSGERLYLTLERDGTLTISEEWPDGI